MSHPATKQRQRMWIIGYKNMMGCRDCQAKDVALTFDHLPGTVKHPKIRRKGLSTLVGYKPTTIWEEMQKCEVVCADCHEKRTMMRGQRGNFLTVVDIIPRGEG